MIDYSFYLCTDSDMNTEYKIDECVKQAILGGVTFVQVREKNKSYAEFLKIALSIKKITDMYNIPLVINDNINIAIQIDASGVHLRIRSRSLPVPTRSDGYSPLLCNTRLPENVR